MSVAGDFVIENGVLKKYTGSDTGVVIPEGVTSIGDSAFRFCKSLTTVVISNGVQSICNWAFCNCQNLKSITLSDSVTSLGLWALEGCDNLEAIVVSGNNPCYSSVDGVLFDKSENMLVKFPCGKKTTDYTVPDSVTSIGEVAFYECKKLKSITIPDSVTTIGDNAFRACEGLTSIIIPDSVTRICYQAFSDCYSLTSIKISGGIKNIESGVFGNCKKISSVIIPDGVESIGKNAFCDCDNLTTIIFPGSVKKISDSAFWYCPKLKYIELPASIEKFEGSALEVIWNYFWRTRHRLCLECTFLTQVLPVVLDNKQISKLIKSDKKHIFAKAIEEDDPGIAESLLALYKNITLDMLNRYIEKTTSATRVKAFLLKYKADKYSIEKQEKYENVKLEKALGLKELTVTDWKKIYNFTTENNKVTITRYKGTDTKIEIPKKIGKYMVVAIGEKAFSPETRGLRAGQKEARAKILTVVIPGGVTSIGRAAFSACQNLTTVMMTDSVKCIGEGAFDGCEKLTIYAPAGSYAEEYANKNNIPFIAE